MGKPFAAIFNPAVAEGRGGQFILVGICSCRGYVAKREAVRQTWMRQLPNHIRPVFFVGEGEGPVEADAPCAHLAHGRALACDGNPTFAVAGPGSVP